MFNKQLFSIFLSAILTSSCFFTAYADENTIENTSLKNLSFEEPLEDMNNKNLKELYEEIKISKKNGSIMGIINKIENCTVDSTSIEDIKLITISTNKGVEKFLINFSDSKTKIIGDIKNLKIGTSLAVITKETSSDNKTIIAKQIIILPKVNLNNNISTDEQIEKDFKIITDTKTLVNLRSWINSKKHFQGVYQKKYNDKNYILICAGRRTTGGYVIKLNKIYTLKEDPSTLYIDYKVIPPAPGMIVTQAITYPHLLIQVDESYENVKPFNKEQPFDLKELNENITLKDLKKRINSADSIKTKQNLIQNVINYLSDKK